MKDNFFNLIHVEKYLHFIALIYDCNRLRAYLCQQKCRGEAVLVFKKKGSRKIMRASKMLVEVLKPYF